MLWGFHHAFTKLFYCQSYNAGLRERLRFLKPQHWLIAHTNVSPGVNPALCFCDAQNKPSQ